MKTKPVNSLKKNLAAAVFILLAVLLAGSALSEIEPDIEIMNLAGKLAEMRGEVEDLSDQLKKERAAMADQLRSLAAQKAELEVQVKKEELRIKQIEQSIEKQKGLSDSKQMEESNLKPLAAEQTEKVEAYMAAALPFKVSERTAELEKLRARMAEDKLPPEKVVSQLWALMEGELRLTGETGMYRQSIELEGEDILAEVARVGMMMLFFKTEDNRVGKALRVDDRWEYRVIEDEEQRKMVLHLFDSLKKRIHEGYFVLPNAIREGVKP